MFFERHLSMNLVAADVSPLHLKVGANSRRRLQFSTVQS